MLEIAHTSSPCLASLAHTDLHSPRGQECGCCLHALSQQHTFGAEYSLPPEYHLSDPQLLLFLIYDIYRFLLTIILTELLREIHVNPLQWVDSVLCLHQWEACKSSGKDTRAEQSRQGNSTIVLSVHATKLELRRRKWNVVFQGLKEGKMEERLIN